MTARQWRLRLTKKIKQGEDELNDTGIKYPCFEEYPEIFKLRREDQGKQVWLAGHYRTFKAKLRDIDDGELNILEIRDKQYKTLFPNEAILHPSEIDEERLEEFGYEVKDGRKK